MITVGYGDIVPLSNYEILFSICAMLLACGIFAYCVGAIENILEEL